MFSIKHLFRTTKSNGPDSTLVRPTAWNDDHEFETTSITPMVLGRTTPGPGPIEELPISVMFPTGAVTGFAGATAPPGWLLCYGQSLNQVDYPALYAVIGTTYGAGPGPATFQVPDLRGVPVAGKSNMGGADRGNLPGGAVLGQYLGAPATSGFNLHSTGTNSIGFGNVGFNQTFGAVAGASGGTGYQPGGSSLNFVQANDPVTVQGFVAVGGNFGIAVDGFIGPISLIQPTVVLNQIIKT